MAPLKKREMPRFKDRGYWQLDKGDVREVTCKAKIRSWESYGSKIVVYFENDAVLIIPDLGPEPTIMDKPRFRPPKKFVIK